MRLLILTKKIDDLLTVLKIDKTSIVNASKEELDVILAPMPIHDRKVMLSINYLINKSSSIGMVKKYDSYSIENPSFLIRSYFNYSGITNELEDHKEIINYVLENKLIVEIRDVMKKANVVTIDDAFLYKGLTGNINSFMVATTSLQVYNEVVSTGRTPVNLIKQLFKYI